MAGYYSDVRVQILVCLIYVISAYSNGAVPIRVGLELADGPHVGKVVARSCRHSCQRYIPSVSCWQPLGPAHPARLTSRHASLTPWLGVSTAEHKLLCRGDPVACLKTWGHLRRHGQKSLGFCHERLLK